MLDKNCVGFNKSLTRAGGPWPGPLKCIQPVRHLGGDAKALQAFLQPLVCARDKGHASEHLGFLNHPFDGQSCGNAHPWHVRDVQDEYLIVAHKPHASADPLGGTKAQWTSQPEQHQLPTTAFHQPPLLFTEVFDLELVPLLRVVFVLSLIHI